jgi:hypothetical protein
VSRRLASGYALEFDAVDRAADQPPRLHRLPYGDHRRTAGVDGVDDLGVVDALEVDRDDAEVGVLDMRVIAK